MRKKKLTPGERVRARRMELGWSQARVAEQVGVVHSIISRIESGTTPSYWTARRICDVLDLDIPEWDTEPVKRPIR